jgi:hypothetical protein
MKAKKMPELFLRVKGFTGGETFAFPQFFQLPALSGYYGTATVLSS